MLQPCHLPGVNKPLNTVVTDDPSKFDLMMKPLEVSLQYMNPLLQSRTCSMTRYTTSCRNVPVCNCEGPSGNHITMV